MTIFFNFRPKYIKYYSTIKNYSPTQIEHMLPAKLISNFIKLNRVFN